MTEGFNLIPVISGVIGALIGATSANYFASKSRKSNQTFEFHKEFNSTSFSKYRSEAYLLIKNHPNKNYDELWEEEFHGNNEVRTISLYMIMRFYQRLWLAIKYDKIDNQIAPDLFGEVFVWWYYFSFEKNLVEGTSWTAGGQMLQLERWFQKNMNVVIYKNEMNNALERLIAISNKVQ
ncbi:hypothetical protein [Maribacter sp. 4G9]|uniref:hypothetical protein n=1 Tax=Maribacter sp. 4G9 TaxID=1889777 RepID=UPI000C152B03|nr:hypothetical protein [Maribacter sp. 4G9]PIB27893.1 hypothetical protein BFP75_06405 [Maribacter sp. 4G9]